MKKSIFYAVLCVIAMMQATSGQTMEVDLSWDSQTIIDLSKQKWQWMADREIEPLAELFDEKAMFVHMGGNMTKEHELNVIKSGGIHYKHAEIFETSVRFIGETAILLTRIQLDAVVGGNEVTNPFTVTEVYVKKDNSWKLGSMSFTRLLTPR